MKKIYLLVILVVIVSLGAFLLIYSNQVESDPVESAVTVFTDAENNQFTIQYGSDTNTAQLSVDGVDYELEHAVSASGAKYQTSDGQVVFWERGGEATVEIGGEVVFEDAMTEERRVEVLKSNKQGDPDANRYDFGTDQNCDGVDQDCTVGDVSVSNNGGSITIEEGATLVANECGDGTVPQGDVCVPEAHDHDDDGDGIPVDDLSLVDNLGNYTLEDLTAQAWSWQETVYFDGTKEYPADSSKFIATFETDGTFSSKTDCNSLSGSYRAKGPGLLFGAMAATEMYCGPDTKESQYADALAKMVNYMITAEGNLVLGLEYDSGSMFFAPVTVVSEPAAATDYNSSRSNKSL